METSKVNAIYAGAGVAAAVGLLLGAAMKPDLGMDDRLIGPQIVAGAAGGRSSGPFDDGGFSYAAYGGKVPDYVLGTDYKAEALTPIEASAPQPAMTTRREAASNDDNVETLAFTRADYGDEARQPASYPSIAGGAAGEVSVSPPSDLDDDGQG